jgi:urease accessory protein
MARDSERMRGTRPFVFTNMKTGTGVEVVEAFIRRMGGLEADAEPSPR